MQERTKEHIRLALASDPDISGQLKKRVFSLLEGKPPRRKLIPTREACEILDCHPITLRRLEKRGHLKAIRLSARKIRWDLDEIQNFADYGISNRENEPRIEGDAHPCGRTQSPSRVGKGGRS